MVCVSVSSKVVFIIMVINSMVIFSMVVFLVIPGCARLFQLMPWDCLVSYSILPFGCISMLLRGVNLQKIANMTVQNANKSI